MSANKKRINKNLIRMEKILYTPLHMSRISLSLARRNSTNLGIKVPYLPQGLKHTDEQMIFFTALKVPPAFNEINMMVMN